MFSRLLMIVLFSFSNFVLWLLETMLFWSYQMTACSKVGNWKQMKKMYLMTVPSLDQFYHFWQGYKYAWHGHLGRWKQSVGQCLGEFICPFWSETKDCRMSLWLEAMLPSLWLALANKFQRKDVLLSVKISWMLKMG